MSKKEERAGATYAAEQIESDYFQTWIREQMYEASQMDPSEVLPLETKSDARKIARNMLQQLQWDMKRDVNESAEFFRGVSEYLREPEVVDWLADEVLYRWGEITGSESAVGESPRVADFNTLKSAEVATLPIGSLLWADDNAWVVVPGGIAPITILPKRAGYAPPDGDPPEAIAQTFALIRKGSGQVPTHATAQRHAIAWHGKHGNVREQAGHVVADFNTLNDLIGHAADQLGATHTSGEGAHTKIYFPRGGQYPYEEAKVWRKAGYWHAEGPHARVGVTKLPANALPIARAQRRKAAEPRMTAAARRPTDPFKPRRGTFDIATRGGGRETVKGYVAGDYGMRKVKWFWEFTHLPTGVLLTTYPPHETLDSARAHLEHLARHGPAEHHQRLLKPGTWGLQ